MTRTLLFVVALTGALASACDVQPDDVAEETGPPATPQVSARVVDDFTDVGGRVLDIALVPHPQPQFSRGLAALESGGFGLIDFAFGDVARLEAPAVGYLAAAPDFQLRDTPAPLIVGAGGELDGVSAWIFLAAEGELVEVPLDPIVTTSPLRGICAERATEALLDLLVMTDDGVERWRIMDRGADVLSAESRGPVEGARPIQACAALNGDVLGVAAGGATRAVSDASWGYADGADVASVERSEGWWAFVARPEEGGASMVDPLASDVDVVLEAGLNTAAMSAPALVSASPANFGGAYSDGVLVFAENDRINVIELGGLIAAARATLDGGS